MANAAKNEEQDTATAEPAERDSPLLDLSDQAVKRLLKTAKARGYVTLDGEMDIALALRTIVVPTRLREGGVWTYHVQAAGGIVADSDPDAEYQETVNKAAALVRAIALAEQAFGSVAPE